MLVMRSMSLKLSVDFTQKCHCLTEYEACLTKLLQGEEQYTN